MKVRVNRGLCIGVGNCVALAPRVFRLDLQNKAVANDDSMVEEQVLWDAAQSCPENAIILEDDQGRQLYP
ncbi:MAG: ferredoxin [Dehalococcoidia bacterium]|nr:ferredoxin [Dehalococcoidia bacterium]